MNVSTASVQRTFEPPGPGTWQINLVSQPRPAPLCFTEIYPEPHARGFREATKRYGLLLDMNETQFVNGYWYLAPRLVAPEEVPARLATVATVFERRLWREDLELWDREVKPQSIKENRALQVVEPATLGVEALVAHLERCREHLVTMYYRTMRFTVPAILPVGDFIAQAGDWTGQPAARLTELLQGASPISAGALDELDRLVGALEEDKAARAALNAEDAATALRDLSARPGDTGSAARAYIELVGFRLISGFNLGEPYVLEMPEVLVRSIEAALARGKTIDDDSLVSKPTRVRDLVPEDKRANFDELLSEARLVYRLREERSVLASIWAMGIVRRSILSAGERLATAGRIQSPEHLIEAGWEEMRSLVSAGRGPSAAELAERAEYRRTTDPAVAPAMLGPEPEAPPSLDGLPPAALRAVTAMQTAVHELFGHSEAANEQHLLRGLAASPGVYEGRAVIIAEPNDLGRLRQGDVLVAGATSEAMNPALPVVGAIVTDWGGLLSHAAIVSREFGIPSVVGTREATQLIPDGARVRVDGTAGEVTVL